MAKVNIDQFALEVSDDLDMSKKDAKKFVQLVFAILAENVAAGHEVNIPGFGKFRRKDKPARKGRNPTTGEEVDIPAKSVPNFLAAKQLKEDCNA
jgi:DNA-binding protein HU-beta